MRRYDENKAIGDRGEALVADSLENDGFSILARNYKKQFGEIDIIAQRGELIAFVEVKTRVKYIFDLTELITLVKQKRIIAAAKAYIAERAGKQNIYRFDVALIEDVDAGKISYIPNAFTEEERY